MIGSSLRHGNRHTDLVAMLYYNQYKRRCHLAGDR